MTSQRLPTEPDNPNNPESAMGSVPASGQAGDGPSTMSPSRGTTSMPDEYDAPVSPHSQASLHSGSADTAGSTAERRAGEGAEQPFAEPGHRARMLSNNSYNLIRELSELLAGTWRIDGYLKDAGQDDCQYCGRLWQDIRKQDEILVEKLRQEIVNHAKSGTFT